MTDLKPAMLAPTATEADSTHYRPIILSFATPGEFEVMQRCLATFVPTTFCPSVQSLIGSEGSRPDGRDKNNWCHLDSSDVTTVQTYFQYYGRMTNQMNMLQDSVRTELYRQSIFSNPSDFRGKRIMDVGAGSGILSFFSAQAGASVM